MQTWIGTKIESMIKNTRKSKLSVPKPESPKLESAKVVPPPRAKGTKPAHICLEFQGPEAKTVCVAGSFNEWKPEKAPLLRKSNGLWVGDVVVQPGRYEYLFVVDGQWIPDPKANETVQNPFGGKNSVLTVSE